MPQVMPQDPLLASLLGQRVYFDSNIFIYFLDGHPVYFSAVARLLNACLTREIFGATGDVAVAEVMVDAYKQTDVGLIARFKQFFGQEQFLSIAGHNTTVFDDAAQLAARNGLKFVDALHLATATSIGCTAFVTNDRRIASIERVQVVQLADFI